MAFYLFLTIQKIMLGQANLVVKVSEISDASKRQSAQCHLGSFDSWARDIITLLKSPLSPQKNSTHFSSYSWPLSS